MLIKEKNLNQQDIAVLEIYIPNTELHNFIKETLL